MCNFNLFITFFIVFLFFILNAFYNILMSFYLLFLYWLSFSPYFDENQNFFLPKKGYHTSSSAHLSGTPRHLCSPAHDL